MATTVTNAKEDALKDGEQAVPRTENAVGEAPPSKMPAQAASSDDEVAAGHDPAAPLNDGEQGQITPAVSEQDASPAGAEGAGEGRHTRQFRRPAPGTRRGERMPHWSRNITLNTDHTQRVYRRVFDHLKADLYVLSVVTRAQGQLELGEAADQLIDEHFQKVRDDLAVEMERAEILMDQHDLADMPNYPSAMHAMVQFTSPQAAQFLRLLETADQLIMRMDALWLTGLAETKERTERSYMWQRRLIRTAGRLRHHAYAVRRYLRGEPGEDGGLAAPPVFPSFDDDLADAGTPITAAISASNPEPGGETDDATKATKKARKTPTKKGEDVPAEDNKASSESS